MNAIQDQFGGKLYRGFAKKISVDIRVAPWVCAGRVGIVAYHEDGESDPTALAFLMVGDKKWRFTDDMEKMECAPEAADRIADVSLTDFDLPE